LCLLLLKQKKKHIEKKNHREKKKMHRKEGAYPSCLEVEEKKIKHKAK
jgi:hypothetical protein